MNNFAKPKISPTVLACSYGAQKKVRKTKKTHKKFGNNLFTLPFRDTQHLQKDSQILYHNSFFSFEWKNSVDLFENMM